MVRCTSCDNEVSQDARFCPSCGAPTAAVGLRNGANGGSLLRRLRLGDLPNQAAPMTSPSSISVQTLLDELEEYTRPVTAKLLETHKDQDVAVYAVNMGDHRLGAIIPQLACEAVGGEASDALDLACAYSLGLISGRICDDMMDRTIERRGKRTVWREFGDPVAIPLGFRLVSEMFETLSVYDFSLGRLASDRVARIFRQALVESARAEEKEKLWRRSNAALSLGEREGLAQGKRGALIAAGTAAGAIVGRGSEEEIQLLKDYGMFMGTANQLLDDSGDPDYPASYRKMALSESRDLTSEAVKCTDKLRTTEAQKMLRDLCRLSEMPLL